MKVLLLINKCNLEWTSVPQFTKKKSAASFHERIIAETITAPLKDAGVLS